MRQKSQGKRERGQDRQGRQQAERRTPGREQSTERCAKVEERRESSVTTARHGRGHGKHTYNAVVPRRGGGERSTAVTRETFFCQVLRTYYSPIWYTISAGHSTITRF